MFAKLRSLVAGQDRTPVADRPSMSIEDLMGSFPPMRPVLPPSAVNDDLMAPVYDAVEEELQRAGLLAARQA